MSRIVVIGGTGTIGAQLVRRLAEAGHQAVAGSPSTGVDTVTGEGLARILYGTEVVVDTSKSRSYAPDALEEFFTRGTRNLLTAERAAGVRHHLSLSIVGSDRAPDVPFYRAKARMEEIVRAGDVPWTILHATQFFEFADSIAAVSSAAGEIVLPEIRVRPIAGESVAEELARLVDDSDTSGASGGPARGRDLEIAGPEQMELAHFIRTALGSGRGPITSRPDAAYFGGRIASDALLPDPNAALLGPRLEDWLRGPRG